MAAAIVRSWPRRPVPGSDETDCETTQPITVIVDVPNENELERTAPLMDVAIPILRAPDEWISPDEWATQHSRKPVQP